MPLPADYRPKKGDVLIVHAKVKYDVGVDDDCVHLTPLGAEHQALILDLPDVAGLHCQAWKFGDKFTWKGDSLSTGKVIATCDNQVWVKMDASGAFHTYYANDIKPATE